MQTIGFIGLGIMGQGMARCLLSAGYQVSVWNRTAEKAFALQDAGAKVAASPAEAAQGKDVVITMLADPAAVRECVQSADGVAQTLKPGCVFLDCSTVDPDTTAAVRTAAEAKGARFLDCPVAGSKDAAASGELILMVGGEAEVLEDVRPVLETLSKKIIHAGPAGSGTMIKLCFNLCVGHMAAALAETLVLGKKFGLDPQVMIETFMQGTIGAKFYEWKGGCIMDRDFTTNFSTRLMVKDMGLVMSAGKMLDVPLPITASVKELFAMSVGHGEAEEDFCSVIKVLEDLSGVVVTR